MTRKTMSDLDAQIIQRIRNEAVAIQALADSMAQSDHPEQAAAARHLAVSIEGLAKTLEWDASPEETFTVKMARGYAGPSTGLKAD